MAGTGVVVVGAGLGGLRSAEALRSAGYTGPVTVVGEEPWLPYNRPPLSKEALKDGVDQAALEFRRRATVGDVDWRLDVRAEASDLAARTLTLSDGSVLEFEGLVAASGLRPFRLPVPGPVPGRHVLRTVEDAADLRAALRPGARVVVAGAGFIGCEVAATATTLGAEVVNVAIDSHPMLRPLGVDLAASVQERLESRGLRFLLGVGIERYLGDDEVAGVELSDGTVLEADVVVEAVGSRCNTEWLAGNDLDLSNGVLVDPALRVVSLVSGAVHGVHAVGDIARFPNALFDEVPRRVEHWSLPTDTGRRAGAVLAAWLGGDHLAYEAECDRAFAPVPSFWSDLFEVRLQSFGMPGIGDEVRVVEGELAGDSPVVVAYVRDGVLVGVVSVDATKQAMSYRPRLGKPLD